jgi:cell division protein FtsX
MSLIPVLGSQRFRVVSSRPTVSMTRVPIHPELHRKPYYEIMTKMMMTVMMMMKIITITVKGMLDKLVKQVQTVSSISVGMKS